MFLCTICAMEHLDVSLLSVCAQTVDRHIGTKRKRKFNENQENNSLGECKQLSQEKKSKHLSDTLDSKQTPTGCPMF